LVDDALYRSSLSDRREAEANSLAADLLMPAHLLAPLLDQPVSDLADRFQVSVQAMQIRVQALRGPERTDLAGPWKHRLPA
jgi:Zn-dependent peptidase ImmA (M78 family)